MLRPQDALTESPPAALTLPAPSSTSPSHANAASRVAPLIVSHRTNMGTHAENTLQGIDAAIGDGADAVEVDVRATRDGHLVLMHDGSLNRTTGLRRRLSSLDLADLGAVRVRNPYTGEVVGAVPTLGETVRHVNRRAVLVIDVKHLGVEHMVGDLLRARRRGPVWVWTSDMTCAAGLRGSLPRTIPVSLIVGPRMVKKHTLRSVVTAARQARLSAVLLEPELITETNIQLARGRGLGVHCGATDDSITMRRVSELGVDSVCTNQTALAVNALRTVRTAGDRVTSAA